MTLARLLAPGRLVVVVEGGVKTTCTLSPLQSSRHLYITPLSRELVSSPNAVNDPTYCSSVDLGRTGKQATQAVMMGCQKMPGSRDAGEGWEGSSMRLG